MGPEARGGHEAGGGHGVVGRQLQREPSEALRDGDEEEALHLPAAAGFSPSLLANSLNTP